MSTIHWNGNGFTDEPTYCLKLSIITKNGMVKGDTIPESRNSRQNQPK